MAHAVVFRLEAPIAAFGDLAVGERRGSRRRPTASAIFGLLACALGIGRDGPGHETLAADWRVALRADRLGAPLADFQTAQTPPQKKGRTFATRRDELADRLDLGTIVSRRDHFTDAAFTVVLWPADGEGRAGDAAEIAAALNRPCWALYVGRRACPPSRPLAAIDVDAASLAAAFDAFDAGDAEAHARATAAKAPLPAPARGDVFAIDAAFVEAPLTAASIDFEPYARETVRDAVVDRPRRQFRAREELLARRRASPEARP